MMLAQIDSAPIRELTHFSTETKSDWDRPIMRDGVLFQARGQAGRIFKFGDKRRSLTSATTSQGGVGTMIRQRILIGLLGAAAVVAAAAGGSAAASAAEIKKPANYPSRTIEVTVPFGPGGGADIMARAMAPLLEKRLGVSVAVVNRPGANSIVGMTYLLSQPADGYSLSIITNDTLASMAIGATKIKIDDLAWIARGVADLEMYFVRTNDERFKTFDDYVKLAKANPGKLTMAVGGQGGLETVVAALVNHSAGVSVKFIPFDKPSERFAAFLGGHTDLLLEEPSDMKPYLDEKKVRPILQMIEKRPAAFSDVPTAREKGIDVNIGLWRGVVAKKGTSPEIVNYLAAVVKAVVDDSSFIESYIKKRVLDIRPGYLGPKDFEAVAKKELDQIVQATKILK